MSIHRTAMFCLHLEHLCNEPGTVYVQGKLTLTLSISGYVQVNLITPMNVSGVIIQRRARVPQWVTALLVLYGNDAKHLKNKATVNGEHVS